MIMADMNAMNGMSNVDKTVMEKKYVYKDDNHNEEYASKGVAGTALGLGIAGTALGLLNGGGGILNNLWGANRNGCQSGCMVTCQQRLEDRQTLNNEIFSVWKGQVDADFGLYKSQVDADFGLYKGYRDMGDAILAKQNRDAFDLYKYSRDNYDALKDEICLLKQQVAIDHATEPYKHKIIMDAISLEAERRCCADNKIVNYVNGNFYPINVADITTAATTTPRTTYNPLCGCCNK